MCVYVCMCVHVGIYSQIQYHHECIRTCGADAWVLEPSMCLVGGAGIYNIILALDA
jgi:hypothetical protein